MVRSLLVRVRGPRVVERMMVGGGVVIVVVVLRWVGCGMNVPWPRIHCVSSVMVSPGMAICLERWEVSLRRLAGRVISSSEADGSESSDWEE